MELFSWRRRETVSHFKGSCACDIGVRVGMVFADRRN
jgi:hypothetical protein